MTDVVLRDVPFGANLAVDQIARAPDLNIFANGYVLREADGWQITKAGLAFLTSIEAPALEEIFTEPQACLPIAAASRAPDLLQNVVRIADYAAGRKRPAA